MMYGPGYSGYGFMGGWLGPLLMLLAGLLLLAAAVLLVVWAVRGLGRRPSSGPDRTPASAGHEEAVAIAKKRLAAGEIATEQYEEILRTLAG